jgi:hypothetical protein
MMKNPAANKRPGKLLASVRFGGVRRNRLNGSPISTLLEGYCRESIKRPIGETIRFSRLAGPSRPRWFAGLCWYEAGRGKSFIDHAVHQYALAGTSRNLLVPGFGLTFYSTKRTIE